MRIIGIDPGKTGAYAFITKGDALAEPFPLAGKDLDLFELATEWKAFGADLAIIEKVHAMPGQGVVSMFSFGRTCGQIEGLLAALGIRVEYATPQAWKAKVLSGTPKDKDAAIQYARRAFPAVSMVPAGRRRPHDGMADALCIAEYGRRKFSRPE